MPDITGIIVLPRPPIDRTGTGQRSLLLIEAAAQLGPVHVVLIDGRMEAKDLPGVASVTTIGCAKIAPKGRLARRCIGAARFLAPDWAYRPDAAFAAALKTYARTVSASYVIYRYARLFCATDSAGVSVASLVDVDDRDDQKYASRLDRMITPGIRLLGRPFVRRIYHILEKRLAAASHVWFAGSDDLMPFETAVPSSVIPNVPHDAPDGVTPPNSDSQTVLFVGTFIHKPNRDGLRWFLDTAWQQVTDAVPDADLRVVGLGDWASLATEYAHLSRVTFVGAVDSLVPEYDRASLVVCPMREGGGSKIKVIEAAAYGRPIVGTTFALRGFEKALPGLAHIADTGEGLASACIAYLQDPAKAAKDGAALRQAQQNHYSRHAVMQAICTDIKTAIMP